jgi:predicted O-methyltransferase YrrM
MLAIQSSGRRLAVEVGTAIGYSTLWTALGQGDDGTIVTIDPDTDRTARARAFWRDAGIADDRITVVNGPALDAFRAGEPALAGPFDLAFIDALKPEYPAYLEAIRPRLAPRALVVADNVLWGGRASGARPAREGDGTTQLREVSRRLADDPDFLTTILPIGDGLLAAVLRA